MVAASIATLWAGMLLVWAVVRPGVVEQVGTASLAGVVALLAAPGLALAALRLDTRVAQAARAARLEAEMAPADEGGRRLVVAHDADVPRIPRENRRARQAPEAEPVSGYASTAD